MKKGAPERIYDLMDRCRAAQVLGSQPGGDHSREPVKGIRVQMARL